MLKQLFLLACCVCLAVFLPLLLSGCDPRSYSTPPALSDGESEGAAIPGMDVPDEFVVTDTLVDFKALLQELGIWREPGSSCRLDPNPRLAVMYEAILALAGWDWQTNRSINGNPVSDWNYITDPADGDMKGYRAVKAWYRTCNAPGSRWIGPHSGDPHCSDWFLHKGTQCFYHYPAIYGCINGIGHCGQCVFFVNYVLYRSSVFQAVLPSYATCRNDYNGSRNFTKSYRQTRVGDILRTTWDNGHTLIVVRIVSGTEGSSVTAVQVIDCNFIANEVVGMHTISTSGSSYNDLDNYYAVDLIAMGGR